MGADVVKTAAAALGPAGQQREYAAAARANGAITQMPTPRKLKKLAEQLTARANAELEAAAAHPCSGAAKRLAAIRVISQQMEREGLFEFRRTASGTSLHTIGPPDATMKRFMELIEKAGLLRDDA